MNSTVRYSFNTPTVFIYSRLNPTSAYHIRLTGLYNVELLQLQSEIRHCREPRNVAQCPRPPPETPAEGPAILVQQRPSRTLLIDIHSDGGRGAVLVPFHS